MVKLCANDARNYNTQQIKKWQQGEEVRGYSGNVDKKG